MDFKDIMQTALGVALGVVLAGLITNAINKQKESNFDNED